MASKAREIRIGYNESNCDLWINPRVDGERKGHGLRPRDYTTHPVGCYHRIPPLASIDFPLIPKSEWSDRIKEKVATKSQNSDIRLVANAGQPIPSIDQDGKGYCWAHSVVSELHMLRALMNQPYVGLSAYAIACIEKDFQDEGGWGAESCDFVIKRGVPSYQYWPAQSMERNNDNPATWGNAALHKITGGWYDLAAAQYDRNLTFAQLATILLTEGPCQVDYNWWSHSVCAVDLVETEPGAFGVRIWNSWGDSWSEKGMGILEPDKAVPDGAVCARLTTPSVTLARGNHGR